jgi:ABC-2 type transport system permease protein
MEDHAVRFGHVKVLIDKEWAELLKNKLIVGTMTLAPILFVTVAWAVLYLTSRDPNPPRGMEGITSVPAFAGMDPRTAVQILLVQQFMFYFLMMPLFIPITIAAYSIIGEKQQRSLEPLLAAPITVTELLLSKGLAAVIPAVGVTWLAYAVYVVIARFLSSDPVFRFIVDPMWILAILLLGPLFSILSVNIGILVSSQVNDIRLAEQIGGLLVVPLAILGVPLTAAKILVSMPMLMAGVIAVAIINGIVLALAVGLFQRETILTRWK